MNRKDEQEVKRKLKVLAYAQETGNVSKTCRYWGISRDTFYRWKREYEKHGEKALINSKRECHLFCVTAHSCKLP
ncbi:helix-turn-helix domain-containing protein [Spartinivicinus poritis]|uniref:helix-turn-helix domain-containing protein n=1 Tax=Spartinivicinus poritis TaxID=2994640 RepID=UPI003CC915E1